MDTIITISPGRHALADGSSVLVRNLIIGADRRAVIVRPVSFALPEVASFDRPLWGWRRSIAACFEKASAILREGRGDDVWC